MSSQAQLEKMKVRQNYRNLWHSDLASTITTDTPYCCFSMWCGPCVSYLLRKRALYNDMSRYVCCAGYMPCSGRCGESRCPEFCLCTEVFLCFGNSVASTRFLLQDEFNIQTTKCDNCIIGFMFCLQQLACIFSLVACLVGSEDLSEASQMLSCLADMVYCTVCACMQTQHKIEMDKRDGKFGPQPMAVPPAQHMSRLDQPYPPTSGYPPQALCHPPYPPPQGYPPADYPPPQAQGYPPAGYPPPQAQPHGYSPAGYSPQAQPQGYPPAGYPPQAQLQGHPSAGYLPPKDQAQGYSPAGYPPHQAQSSGYAPAGYSPHKDQAQGYPPHQSQPLRYSPAGNPPQGNPSSGH